MAREPKAYENLLALAGDLDMTARQLSCIICLPLFEEEFATHAALSRVSSRAAAGLMAVTPENRAGTASALHASTILRRRWRSEAAPPSFPIRRWHTPLVSSSNSRAHGPYRQMSSPAHFAQIMPPPWIWPGVRPFREDITVVAIRQQAWVESILDRSPWRRANWIAGCMRMSMTPVCRNRGSCSRSCRRRSS